MYINTSDASSAEVVKLPMLSGWSQAGDAVRKSGWRCGQEVRRVMRSGSQAGDAVRKSGCRCGQSIDGSELDIRLRFIQYKLSILLYLRDCADCSDPDT
jgi:hypothetical protein